MNIAMNDIPTTRHASQPVAREGLAGVSAHDFMNILIKQLQYQDPFEPMTNQEMLSQMATIRELEMTTRLNDRLEQLTDHQRFGMVTSLIGKHVRGEVSDGEGMSFGVEGIVTGVRFTPEGRIMLELDTGDTLPLSALQKVTDRDVFS